MKYRNPKVIEKEGTKNIENKAIKHILKYLKEREGFSDKDIKVLGSRKGADIKISQNGKYIRWIEAKGCDRKETNIRITPQSLFTIAEEGGLKNYFIYSVYEMNSKNPKLVIFDYETFKKHKIVEIKYIIQPSKIKHKVIGL